MCVSISKKRRKGVIISMFLCSMYVGFRHCNTALKCLNYSPNFNADTISSVIKSEFSLSAWPLPRDTLIVINKCSIPFSRQYSSNSFEINALSEIILIGFSKIMDYFFKQSKISAALDLVADNYNKT